MNTWSCDAWSGLSEGVDGAKAGIETIGIWLTALFHPSAHDAAVVVGDVAARKDKSSFVDILPAEGKAAIVVVMKGIEVGELPFCLIR